MTLRVPLEALAPGERALAKEAAAYVARVHRLEPGDTFIAFDPEAAIEADARVIAVGAGGRSVTVHIADARPAAVRPPRPVTLVQALGKGDKMDAIVRDATELGATRIVPVIAERSVARPEAAAGRATERATERAARWRRIAIESARQCGRGDAPRVTGPAPLLDALRALAAEPGGLAPGACLVPGAPRPLADVFRRLRPGDPITLAIGPEGGLTDAEIAACEAAGLPAAGLGPLVLRTETVCAAALGALLVLS